MASEFPISSEAVSSTDTVGGGTSVAFPYILAPADTVWTTAPFGTLWIHNPFSWTSGTDQFTDLITLEHISKPKFFTMVQGTVQAQSDRIDLLNNIPLFYDVDFAVGHQLDVIGQIVGESRDLLVAVPNVFFALDTVNQGFDQGVWDETHASSSLYSLPDDIYRVILKVKVINNQWNGSLSEALIIGQPIFAYFGYVFFIQDNADLTMYIGLFGPNVPSNILLALLTQGKFNIRPAGVLINGYVVQQQPGSFFGFDISNTFIQGFDQGAWAAILPA